MEHGHNHSHDGNPAQESVALLAYMVSHNEHHSSELRELSGGLPPQAEALVLEAVAQFDDANEKLKKALNIVKK